MGFSFLKKKEVSVETEVLIPKTLVLEDNVTQTVNFFKNEEEINYKKTLRVMLESLNLEEIEKVIYYLSIHENKKYSALLEVFQEMIGYGSNLEKPFYGFETKIKRDFSERYEEAKNSLSTGDLIALLLRFYFLYNENRDSIIKPVISEVLADVVRCIKENIPLLRAEIENQLYVPISKALFVFFLYNKKEALIKFKSIIRKDLINKRTTLPELEYIVTANRFFGRLNLDYIPRIDTVSEKFDLVLTDKEVSISKEEVYNEVDKGDFFNQKVPLLDFDASKLLNPRTNILNVDKFTKSVSRFFDIFYPYLDTGKLHFDLGEVFVENITQPYPNYSDEILIRTREILKEMFSRDEDVKLFFLGFIYTKITNNELINSGNKFSKIFNKYLEGLDKYSERTIKNYLIDSTENPFQKKKASKKLNNFSDRHPYVFD